MWIFGYGSILWKVDFPHERKQIGYIKGYVRRFYQHSTDHRGTPETPGRVVTLLPSDNLEDHVWGIAYNIPTEKVEDVLNHLDYRERGGYERRYASFHPKETNSNPFEIIIYVATEQNHNYAGETNTETIAQQIAIAIGPSGPNVEYVFRLASAMREIAPGVNDEHLFDIEDAVKKVINIS